MYKYAMAKWYIAIKIDHKCNQNIDKRLRAKLGLTMEVQVVIYVVTYVYHSQHMCVHVKLNFTCKEVVKTRVAMYMKVIDVACHFVYMTKTSVCNLHGLCMSHVCHV